MLDSLEICRLLEGNGYSRKYERAYARGYVHPGLEHPLFVKHYATGRSVGRQPLVLHPAYRKSAHWAQIKALTRGVPNETYKSTSLEAFPFAPGSTSKTGIAVNVANVDDLLSLFGVLGGELVSIEKQVEDEVSLIELFEQSPTGQQIGTTEREAIIRARVGQGVYRQALLEHWQGCAVSGFALASMLRASHIKPWRDATHLERLDPFNGLLLTPNLDQAFDLGLISFTEKGDIVIAQALTTELHLALGINPQCRLRSLHDRHLSYLAWHREHVFCG
ncbi:HNH endonuclease [Pseudomonas tolaasii]|uniref:HNH endonuclease n=1 Tax=Pseudomonas tolaasii NCPPB 2192 TaxID=564423 RepID=A0ABX4QAD9_PSETO|nr:HNH endonuclease [Pseudomonas tolaasii]ARB28982.1 HNH endonuclease [Pseudomonas tolaasii]KAB0474796.1 HNH endonuclease [Pseudomonas tolaasii]PKA73754.1 HNH endonuclease [Pseudomonas tolaasii NCPPB 2192]